jgi:iron complex outermembrane receptor protein
MNITLHDHFNVATNTTKPYDYSADYNGLVSPHVAINKVFGKTISAYAAYSKGYKAPVSSYFYIPYNGTINTNLKSEVGNQFEIGTKGNLLSEKLSYELALFYTKFSNKMTAVAVPNNAGTATLYSYMVNGGSQKHKGLEFLVKYTIYESATGFFKKIRPFGNLSYSDFVYDNFRIQKSATVTEDYSGKAVAGVPKFAANAGIDLAMKYGLYANLAYSYKGTVSISSDGTNRAHSYMILNSKVGINRSLSKHINLDAYFGVNNITGAQYYYMIFVNQLPDAYLPAPEKANYYGGISLKYNF